jgi:curved DNA-binding protein CbpA
MITIQRRAYERLITELIYARDLRRLVKKYSVDRAYYFSILKDISNGKRSPNYDFLTQVARKKDLSEGFIVEQARAVLNFYVPYDQGQSPDYYKLLKVRSDATDEEIRRSWIELMKSNHPDKVGPQGLDSSKKINEAYEVLRDTAKRDRYDRMHLPFIPVSVERHTPYQNLYYAIPFVIIATFALLYVAGSGLLFKSQEEKERLARVIENPNLPNALYRGDRLTAREEGMGADVPVENLDEFTAAENKARNSAGQVEPKNNIAQDQSNLKALAETESGENDTQTEETVVLSQEEQAKENEPEKIASLTDTDIENETTQAEKSLESEETEDKAGMDADEKEAEEKTEAAELAAAEPEKGDEISLKEIVETPVGNVLEREMEAAPEPEKPEPQKNVALEKDEEESKADEQIVESEPDTPKENLASADTKTEDKAEKVPGEPKPPVLKTSRYGEVYTVKQGDSLWTIARKFDTHTKDILRLNGMTSSTIKPGDDIIVSGKGVPLPEPINKPQDSKTEVARASKQPKAAAVKESSPAPESKKRSYTGISTTAIAAEKTRTVKPAAPAAPSPDKDSLYVFVSDYVSAYKSRDVSRVKSLFAPDAVENGKSISTVINSYSSNFATLEIISYDVKVRNAAVYNNTGTVGGDFYVSFRDQRTGVRKSSRGRINWKLFWESGEWKIKELSYKVENTDS